MIEANVATNIVGGEIEGHLISGTMNLVLILAKVQTIDFHWFGRHIVWVLDEGRRILHPGQKMWKL